MPHFHVTPLTKKRASLASCAAFAVLAVSGFGAVACSKGESDEGTDAGEEVDASSLARSADASQDAADAPVDARAAQELAAIADAGRFCGEKDLPACPLQGWMKRNAKTMITFGDIATIAEVFDRIADFAPVATDPDGHPAYPNWVSIAHDGAAAARSGDLNAAKAACRGCHRQYKAGYHAFLRGRPLPPDAPEP